MKNKIIYKILSKVLIGYSFLLLIPLLVSIIYKENIYIFLVPMIFTLIIGLLLNQIKIEEKEKNIYAKDGFIIVALAWIIISVISALPYYLGLNISLSSAIFESVSGLTTTGASIFKDIESLNKSILFYRCFTHYVGGMGVLAFVMAVIPLSKTDKSMYLLKAEMAGPTVSKLVPSIKKTLLYLYGIYIGLTLLEFILLILGKMNIFDSILISLSTAGTGGFSVLNSSIQSYSIYSKCVIAIFMFLFGINFNIYFLILMKKIKTALKSEELRFYILIVIFSIILVSLNTYKLFNNINDMLIFNTFHVTSIISSTGFSIGDINIYPTFSRIILLCITLISACAGSTCGGFKITRLLLCLKIIKKDFLKAIHPNSVHVIKYEGKRVDDDTLNSTISYMFMYVLILIIIILLVSIDNFTFEQTINAVFTTYGNVGLCFDITNYSVFSDFSKIILSIGMLFGRLEILPLIVLFSDLRK